MAATSSGTPAAPPAIAPERWEAHIMALLEPGLRLAGGGQAVLHLRVGIEWLAVLDADGPGLIDHRAISLELGLTLHDPVSNRKKFAS
jgi:hypothetical protein